MSKEKREIHFIHLKCRGNEVNIVGKRSYRKRGKHQKNYRESGIEDITR